jgi:hypothetical protein
MAHNHPTRRDMITSERLVARLAANGLSGNVTEAPDGSTLITFDFGVLVNLHGGQVWHWSVVQTSVTQAGEGCFDDSDGCDAFLQCLECRPHAALG